MSANPYQSPPIPEPIQVPSAETNGAIADDTWPAVSVAETFGARYLAFAIDNICALFSTFVAAKSISDSYPVLQVVAFISVYFLYFFVFESLTGRSVGKLLLGLVVIQADGRRMTCWQAFLRTVLRLFEVNPIFGALPAAISAWTSPLHQRIGDRLAGTIVVRSWRWRSYKRRMASSD